MEIRRGDLGKGYYSVIASISTAGKVEHLLIKRDAINGAHYKCSYDLLLFLWEV